MRINRMPSASCSAALLLTCLMGGLSFGQTPAQWVDGHNNYRRNLIGFDGNQTSSPDLSGAMHWPKAPKNGPTR